MNIVNILKDCPEGTELYSTLRGECELAGVFPNPERIKLKCKDDGLFLFLDKEGKLFSQGECLLFPSKEQRDWNDFKIPRKELPEGTICVCFADKRPKNLIDVYIRYYCDKKTGCYECGKRSSELKIKWNYMIPIDKFDFKNLTFNEEDNYGTAYNKE